jgi:hypothetical protein
MKFRYAAAVQRSLAEHRDLLDISRQLTAINCDIEEMRAVAITRCPPQAEALREMMVAHDFEVSRMQRWNNFLDGPLARGEAPNP